MCLSLVYLPILLDEKQNKNKMEDLIRDQRRKKIPRTGVAIWTASHGSGDMSCCNLLIGGDVRKWKTLITESKRPKYTKIY